MFDRQISLGSTFLLVTLVLLNLFALTILHGCAEPPDNQDNSSDNPNVTPEPPTLVLLVTAVGLAASWYLIRLRKR